jgi:hypothetical protein
MNARELSPGFFFVSDEKRTVRDIGLLGRKTRPANDIRSSPDGPRGETKLLARRVFRPINHLSLFTVFLRRLRARTGTRKSHRDPAEKPHRDMK